MVFIIYYSLFTFHYFMNIAFTGWGSGGHVTPIASLIEYGLQDTDITSQCKLFRFGEQGSLEETTCARYPTVLFLPIQSGKLRRYWTIRSIRQNIVDAWQGVVWIWQSYRLLQKHAIWVVFCKGGYVALPVCIAARMLRIPIILHESDTYGWATNRLVAKMAKTVFTGFPHTFLQSVVIWQLLSLKLLTIDHSFVDMLYTYWKTTVLVTGWSQGAARIFDALLSGLAGGSLEWFHFLVLLGTKNIDYAAQFEAYSNVTSFSFIEHLDQIAALCQMSDLSITRGSATSLAEQQLFGLKKIIIPLPHTWGNHQYHNAKWYEEVHGDLVLEQNDAMEEQLLSMLSWFVGYKKIGADTIDEEFIKKPLEKVWNALLK